MKRFLISVNIVILLCIMVLMGALFLIPNRVIEGNSLYASIDKHHRLDSIATPKIILIGGSNLAFGINSKMIEDSIGMPVVNMGLHAGFGLNFILSECNDNIKQGDIVILSPEYHHFTATKMFYGEDVLVALLFDVNPSLRKFISFKQWVALCPEIMLYSTKKLLPLWKKIGQSDFERVYMRNSFNVYGDEVAHIGWANCVSSGGTSVLGNGNINMRAINAIIEFKEIVEDQGAFFMNTPSPFPRSQYNIDKDVIDKISDQLSINGVPFCGNLKDFIYSDSLFFNTIFHLNGNGRDLRTQQLIRLIQDE